MSFQVGDRVEVDIPGWAKSLEQHQGQHGTIVEPSTSFSATWVVKIDDPISNLVTGKPICEIHYPEDWLVLEGGESPEW